MVNAGGQTPDRLESLKIVVTDPIISRFEEKLRADGGTHQWDMAAAWTPERRLSALAGADVVVCSSLGPAEAEAAGRVRLVHVTGCRLRQDFLPAPGAVSPGGQHLPPRTAHRRARPDGHPDAFPQCCRRRPGDPPGAVADHRNGRRRAVPSRPRRPDAGAGGPGFHRRRSGPRRRNAGHEGPRRAAQPVGRSAATESASTGWAETTSSTALLAASDVVVVTVPLDSETEGMIGAAELACHETLGVPY